jgi:outer membrane protein assembly factor BamB
MKLRWLRFVSTAGLALATAAGVVALSCGGGEDAPANLAPTATEAGIDALLVGGDAAPSRPIDAEPPPGEVCGNKTGLFATSPWPLRGGCPTRAGWSSTPGPQSGTVSWTVAAPMGQSSPAVLGTTGMVWVGTSDGLVLAVGNGVVRFAFRIGGAVKASPAIDSAGTAIVGSDDGILYGLNVGDGSSGTVDAGPPGAAYAAAKLAFAYAVGPMASSPVIGADGTIYVGTLDGKLVAVAATHTATSWAATTNDTNGSSPALGQDGTIYVGSSDHKLYAIAPDGAIKWAVDLGAEIRASPAVGGDATIYIGTLDGKLHAVDPSGAVRWAYAAEGPITETPAVYAGSVYVGSEDKKLHAVSTITGLKRWTYATLGAVATPLIGPDGTVYVGTTDGHVYAITPKGNLSFAATVKGKVRGAPALAPGPTLFVVTDTGIVAIGP